MVPAYLVADYNLNYIMMREPFFFRRKLKIITKLGDEDIVIILGDRQLIPFKFHIIYIVKSFLLAQVLFQPFFGNAICQMVYILCVMVLV